MMKETYSTPPSLDRRLFSCYNSSRKELCVDEDSERMLNLATYGQYKTNKEWADELRGGDPKFFIILLLIGAVILGIALLLKG